jgi:hypothetical protein
MNMLKSEGIRQALRVVKTLKVNVSGLIERILINAHSESPRVS